MQHYAAFHLGLHCLPKYTFRGFQYTNGWNMRPWKGVPVSHIPLTILKKISHISNINMANIPKIQKALYPHIPKINPSIPYPIKYLQKYPASLWFLANIPVYLKTLPGPQTYTIQNIIEQRHEISNNMVCATSKASGQPAHTRSLIRAFASRLSILWV